jgi:hypothetical protein
MYRDEIIAEVWRIRDAYAAEHDHDLDKIVADLEARQRRPGCVLADRRVGAAGVADDGTRADRR